MAQLSPLPKAVYCVADGANLFQMQMNPVELEVEVDAEALLVGTPQPLNIVYPASGGNAQVGDFFQRVVTSAVGNTGTVELRMNQGVSSGSQREALAEAIAAGAMLVGTCPFTTTGLPENAAIQLQLRGMSTADFAVDPSTGQLEPAFHGGAVSLWHTGATPPVGSTFSLDGPLALTLSGSSFLLPASVTDVRGIDDPSTGTSPYNRTLTLDVFGGDSHQLPIDLHIATDTVVLMDRSGSMAAAIPGGVLGRWEAAHAVCSLFAQLLQEMVTAATVPETASIAARNKVDYGAFHASAGPAVDYTGGVALLDASAGTLPSDPTPGGLTPIVQSLVSAASRLVALGGASVWKRRHIVLVTDGLHNVGADTVAGVAAWSDATAAANGLPRASADPSEGVTLHAISYAPPGATDEALADVAAAWGGAFHASSPDPNPTALGSLWEMLMDVLGRIIPVERSAVDPVTHRFAVEDHLDRVMVVKETTGSPAALELSNNLDEVGLAETTFGPGAAPHVSVGTVANFRWLTVDHPAFPVDPSSGVPEWEVSAGSASIMHAFYDLSLRMTSGVSRGGLGDEMRLWVELRHLGGPVTGARVRAGLSRPAESLGGVLTSFVRTAGLVRAQRLSALSAASIFRQSDALTVVRPGASAEGLAGASRALAASSGDPAALQRVLLSAAESSRALPFQYVGSALELIEVVPGRYEATVPESWTAEEGDRTFHVRADGLTPQGGRFARARRVSSRLPPIPDPAQSQSFLVATPAPRDQLLWKATVFPVTKTGNPVGPGLAHVLSFAFIEPALRAERAPLELVDNLDGTYGTQVVLGAAEGPPWIGLYWGPADGATMPAVPLSEATKVHKVKVVLEKVQILDDKDGCLLGAGELAFDTVVAPNGNPNRAVRKRIPMRGVLKLGPGQSARVDEVVYEGYVEGGASLDIGLGATEFDWLLLFTRKERLTRYHRLVSTAPGVHSYSPDDEPGDPESLADWRVWYRVEVE